MGSSKSKSKKPQKGEVSLMIEGDAREVALQVVVPQDLLVAHSPVFRDMALAGMLKRSRKIKLENVTVVGLTKILKYVEESSIKFDSYTEALETLTAAREYKIEVMENICVGQLLTLLDPSNACQIYEYTLSTPEYAELTYRCLNCIDKSAEEILKSPGFCNLRQDSVNEILRRHTLNVPSEMTVFRAVLQWAEADCRRRGLSPTKFENLLPALNSMVTHVRFMTLSQEDLEREEVIRCYDLLTSKGDAQGVRPVLQRARSSVVDAMALPKRRYAASYCHGLDVYASPQHSASNGETFCLTLEMLKGRMCLVGVGLAMEAFVATKTASCLYVVLTATNVSTTQQKTVRGAFLNTKEEANLVFSSPLPLKASERAVLALKVKRVENVRPWARRNEVEIVMPDTKDVAVKVLADDSPVEQYVRCIFRDIRYFF